MDWKYLYTSREGRITRKSFWLASLVLFVISLLAVFLLMPIVGLLAMIVFIPLWVAGLMVMLKRAHDRDRPEWYVYGYVVLSILTGVLGFLMFDPANPESMTSNGIVLTIVNVVLMIWGIVLLVDLGFLRGTRGPNQYGPDPLG